MPLTILIQMLGDFAVVVDGKPADWFSAKTPKGVSLVEMLILNRNEVVSRRRLFQELWGNEAGLEYNRALKTLVCRTRQHLNQIADGLGKCIVTAQSGYCWQNMPGLTVDAMEVLALCARMKLEMQPEHRLNLTRQLVALYTGDLYLNGNLESGVSLAAWLHGEYMGAIGQCLRTLRKVNCPAEICDIAAAAIRVDCLDEDLSASYIRALLTLNRPQEARMEYLRLIQSHRRELSSPPSSEFVHLRYAITDAERRQTSEPH